MIKIHNFINGKFIASDKNLEDINPANGEKIAYIPNSNRKDVDLAVQAADSARESWSALSIGERAFWLGKIADALEIRSEEIASLESL
ncbi:MAG TPA: aldehyde dehydrogenase family protein, partial [Marine Group III euryarchaeote]|nr:aldehyde dehydrogenase family protein [Marine Group III euryarchaeote]